MVPMLVWYCVALCCTPAVCAVALAVVFRLMTAMCGRPLHGSASSRRTVAVVVLGDIGRSPRMQYHCMSLAGLANTEVPAAP